MCNLKEFVAQVKGRGMSALPNHLCGLRSEETGYYHSPLSAVRQRHLDAGHLRCHIVAVTPVGIERVWSTSHKWPNIRMQLNLSVHQPGIEAFLLVEFQLADGTFSGDNRLALTDGVSAFQLREFRESPPNYIVIMGGFLPSAKEISEHLSRMLT